MKRKKDSHRQQNPLRGSSSPYSALSQQEFLDPMKPVYTQSRLDGRFKLTAGVFSRLLTNNEKWKFFRRQTGNNQYSRWYLDARHHLMSTG